MLFLLSVGHPEGEPNLPLRLWFFKSRAVFPRSEDPWVGRCLPSDWGSLKTEMSPFSDSGSLKELCVSPALWILKGRVSISLEAGAP